MPSKIILTLLCGFTLITCQVKAADWAVDFDSPLPANWTVGETTFPAGGSSATFSAIIDGGVLRLSDTVAADAGGSFSAFAGTTDVFSNVTVGANVNVIPDANDDLGVVARADLGAGNAYFGSVDFERGEACITKVRAFDIGSDLACSAQGSLDTSSSYRLELTATGASTTNLTLEVFDAAGTTLLQTVNAVDDGTIADFGAAYESGVSGVFLVPMGTTVQIAATDPINGTFDNLSSAVPEPGSSLLLLLGFMTAMLGRRSRKA